MSANPEKVITTDSMCACRAVHTHHVHHRDFPEVHVEGLTTGDAATSLVDRLESILDVASGQTDREQVEQAIADVRVFIERNPPSGLAEAPASCAESAQPGSSLAFDVRPLGAALAEARSAPLIQTNALEVTRMVIRQDREIPAHESPGEATVQCLEGLVDFHVRGTTHRLVPGQLIHLHKGEPHALVALVDSSLLVTIAR